MSFFGSDTKQNINAPQTGASDEAVAGTGNAVGRDDAQVLYAAGSNVVLAGGRQAYGSNLAESGGLLLSGVNEGNISFNDPAALKPITDSFSATVKALSDSSDLDTQKFTELIAQQAEQNAALAESKQTEGVSSLGKLALWGLGIAAAAFVAAVMYRK